MSHRRFRVDRQDVMGAEAFIRDGEEIRHITRVLRLKVGDGVRLFDGEGKEYEAVINAMTPDRISFLLRGRKSEAGCESPLRIVLGAALLKSPRFDWLLQKVTELGVAEVIPFHSSRVVPRPERISLESKQRRWQKIADEASKQCGRTSVPRVQPLRSFQEILATEIPSAVKIFFWEKSESSGLAEVVKTAVTSVFALVGPEGGFSEEEARMALEAGFQPIRLGPRILRAETAAIVAVTLIQYACGDLG